MIPNKVLGPFFGPKIITFATLQPFLERITSKLYSWTIKTFTFAGKMKLIYSVIYGMTNFWSSVFVLEKRFYQKVDYLCSWFLWKHNTASTTRTQVSWSSICTPKKEEGLGFRNFKEFVMVFRLKHLWNFSQTLDLFGLFRYRETYLMEKNFWLVHDFSAIFNYC